MSNKPNEVEFMMNGTRKSNLAEQPIVIVINIHQLTLINSELFIHDEKSSYLLSLKDQTAIGSRYPPIWINKAEPLLTQRL